MALTGNAAHAIITKGLSCGQTTACENGTMITAGPFSLFCVNPIPEKQSGGGGGYMPNHVVRPLQPGEIAQLYQPVPDQQQYYVVPRDQEAEYLRRYLPVRIELKIGNVEVEKQFMVTTDKARIIFNNVQMMNTTKERISVAVSGLTRVVTEIVVKVTNFALRRPKQ